MASTTAINSLFSTNTANCVWKITHFRRATVNSFIGLRKTTLENYHSLSLTKSLSSKPNPRRFHILASKSSPKLFGRNLRVSVIGRDPPGSSALMAVVEVSAAQYMLARARDGCRCKKDPILKKKRGKGSD
uniref:Uncharacterized protein n=1 Tax=Nelumbo nucifera TaxID=4432 RepID=A0A822Y2P7_NELNU|nr:TPA_asm: hypothetical protein HUJ06_028348 [Nelumbo nucifera]